MSDTTPQGNSSKPIDVEELENPNFDGALGDGWEDEDPHAYDYGEFAVKHPLGSVKELEQTLRHKGLELRKKLQADIKENPENWNALKRPASLHSASLMLAEMLFGIPRPDRDQFHEIGDGHVYMPLAIMEKYLYPTLHLMRYLHKNTAKSFPGGVESMIAYSFFLQGQSLPKNRTMHDLTVLRNSVPTSGEDIYRQLSSSVEVTDGLSAQMRSTLKRLQVACTLPSHETLVDRGQEWLDERQKETEDLMRLFLEQVTNDFNAFRYDKEKLILLSHLSQQQAIEVLELNNKLADMIEQRQVQIEQSVGKQMEDNIGKMERYVKDMLDQNRLLFRNAMREVTDNITAYDVNDMRAVLQSQKVALEDALTKNALLVAENSELRMYMSFMPIEYRDHVEHLQAKDGQLYRNQRREPQVIIPDTDHKIGSPIDMEDAPMANRHVQFALRDAQYTTLGEARAQMDRGFALKAKLTTDKATLVYPKTPAPWQDPIGQSGSRPPGSTGPPIMESLRPHRHAPHDPSKWAPAKPTNPPRVTLDQRLTPAGQAMLGASLTVDEALEDGFSPGPPEPDRKGKGWDKGKREAPSQGSRRQPPLKQSRNDAYQSSSSSHSPRVPWKEDKNWSNPRPTAAKPLRAPPLPPTQGSSSNPPSTPLTVLTRGDIGIPPYTGENIRLYTRAEARTAYNIIKPLTLPKRGVNIASSELERVLRKSAEEISAYDNELANFVMDRIDESLTRTNAYAYEVMEGTTKHVVDIYNEKYPPNRRHEKGVLYTMLPPSVIMSVGNYYSILRQRPVAKSNTSYEYMPNATYTFKTVKRNLEQLGFKILPSRMWNEGVFIQTKDEQLHPYVEWCGCNTLDFPAMERHLGLTHISFGTEIVYKEADLPIIPPSPVATATGVKGKRMDPIATVQRLQELGVLPNQTKDFLIMYKDKVDEQIDIAIKEKEKTPFAMAIRIIQLFINRWTLISKALLAVIKPFSAYGPRVSNIAFDPDDRKRKVDLSSLASDSPSITEEDAQRQQDENQQQQQEDALQDQQVDNDETDRQNPEGSGGNEV